MCNKDDLVERKEKVRKYKKAGFEKSVKRRRNAR